MSEPIPESAWKEYATDIWSEFLVRANQSEVRMMSPLEWLTMKGWLDDGIPFRVVLRGLRDCRGRGGRLQYYNPAVREAFAMWRKAVGGWA